MTSRREYAQKLLEERGVNLEEMAQIVFDLQAKYSKGLTVEKCLDAIKSVLEKTETVNAIITGITLDKLAEEKVFNNENPLQEILEKDEGLYGIDEIVALSIVNMYGSIALTNFGYLDKAKPGLIGRLNNHNGNIHVFLDDLVCAIIASACGKIAHTS